MLWHLALHKNRRSAGVYPSSQPVNNGLKGKLINGLGVFVVRRQRVIVSDEKKSTRTRAATEPNYLAPHAGVPSGGGPSGACLKPHVG